MTRQAYGLDSFAQHEFPRNTVGATDPANNQATLQNIRLWDVNALQDTLRQIQEIRTYYDFPDIDIDRYQIDGASAKSCWPCASSTWTSCPRAAATGSTTSSSIPRLRITMNPSTASRPKACHAHALQHARAEHREGPQRHPPEIYFGELTNTMST